MTEPDTHADPSRRPKAVVAVATAVLLVAALALVVALTSRHTRSPAAGGTPPVTQSDHTSPVTSDSTTAAPVDLAALTGDLPCTAPKDHSVSPDELDSIDAVAVFSCGEDYRRYPDGFWTVATRRAATTGIAALVDAMQAPAPPDPSGQVMCAAIAYGEVRIAFVAADGHYVVPTLRRDYCGKPIGLDAAQAITWQELSAQKVRLQESTAEIDAHCSHQYKNMNSYDSDLGHHSTVVSGPVFPDDGTLHACLYRTPDDDPEVGTFVSDRTFTADESARLRTALSGTATTADCAPQHSFALVFDGKLQVDVELGGCWRVLRAVGVGTGDPAVLQDLLGRP